MIGSHAASSGAARAIEYNTLTSGKPAFLVVVSFADSTLSPTSQVDHNGICLGYIEGLLAAGISDG
jgi:hypothetical protein